MGKKELAVFHMVPRVPAAPNLFVHPPADLRRVDLLVRMHVNSFRAVYLGVSASARQSRAKERKEQKK